MSPSGFQAVYFALDLLTFLLLSYTLWQRHIGLLIAIILVNNIPDLFPTSVLIPKSGVFYQFYVHAKHAWFGTLNISSLSLSELDWFQRVKLVASLSYIVSSLLILHTRRALGIALLILYLIPTTYYLHRLFVFIDSIQITTFESHFLFLITDAHSFFSSIKYNPTGQTMLLFLVAAVGLIVVLLVYLTRREFRLTAQWLPNPKLYWVVLDNKARPFQISEHELRVDGCTFNLNKAYRLKSKSNHLFFSTGSSIQFIEKHDPDETPSKATQIKLNLPHQEK